MASSTTQHYSTSLKSPPKDELDNKIEEKGVMIPETSQNANFTTFEDLLHLKGFYQLDFIPQNKILKSLLDHFPIKYYKFTHPQGKQKSWLKQKPVLTLFFGRHSEMSRSQFKHPNQLSVEIKKPYTDFLKIFKLLKNINRNGIDHSSPIVELLRAVSTHNFLQEDQDKQDKQDNQENQNDPEGQEIAQVELPFHLDIYGCIDVPFNPTTPKDLQGLPKHHFYVVNRDQNLWLISYMTKKTEIFLHAHENNLKATLLQGSIPIYLKIQAALILSTAGFSTLFLIFSYIFGEARVFKIIAFCVISLLILSNLCLYGYRKNQTRNFFNQYVSWNILRLKSHQVNEMKVNFTDDYAKLFLHERMTSLNQKNKKINQKRDLSELETKILPKDWKKHAVSPKPPSTAKLPKETTTSENVDLNLKTKKISKFFDEKDK